MSQLQLPRRAFLAGLAATLAAPAIVRATSIMPVRTPSLWRPRPSRLPDGWIECDGRFVSRAHYPELFKALGHRYGGEGPAFRIPDLRGQLLKQWPNAVPMSHAPTLDFVFAIATHKAPMNPFNPPGTLCPMILPER